MFNKVKKETLETVDTSHVNVHGLMVGEQSSVGLTISDKDVKFFFDSSRNTLSLLVCCTINKTI